MSESSIFKIPEISDEEMMRRYSQIKPIVTIDDKKYYLREFILPEVRGKSYIWDIQEDIRDEVKENELEVLEGKDFECLHTYGFYLIFKPSIGEVLSQIPEDVLSETTAFEIIESPMATADFYKNDFTSEAFEKGFHVSTVRLYRERK